MSPTSTNFKVALIAMGIPPFEPWMLEKLSDNRIELIHEECDTPEQVLSVAADADVVFVAGGSRVVTAEVLGGLERCGALLRSGAGTDNIPVDEATRLGIVVAHTPMAHAHAVAEHTVGLLFGTVRRIALQDRFVRQGKWDRTLASPDWHVFGQTLGLVGFGNIGQLVAKKLSGLDMRILVADPVVDTAVVAAHGATSVGLDELLQTSDYISLHTPLTKGTYHLIGERELKLCKPRAVLINTARGPVVDEPALIRALTEGWIAAAALDVLEQEPTPSDNPLLGLDNAIITPHIAGISDESFDLVRKHSIDSLIALSKKLWPPWCANPEVEPRWPLQRG
jgi:D-3-phosphoglycerate dehydrogenase